MKSGACYSLMAVSSQVGLLRNPFSSQVRGSRPLSAAESGVPCATLIIPAAESAAP